MSNKQNLVSNNWYYYDLFNWDSNKFQLNKKKDLPESILSQFINIFQVAL